MSVETGAAAESAILCQDGCGKRAGVVLVNLETGEVDVLAALCHVTMMVAVAQRVTEGEGGAEHAGAT